MIDNRDIKRLLRFLGIAGALFIGLAGALSLRYGLPRGIADHLAAALIKLHFCETDCSLPGIPPFKAIGLLMAVSGGVLALVLCFPRLIRDWLARHYFAILLFIPAFMAMLMFSLAFTMYFSHDAFEHVHCAWMIENGQVPYVDFFENHHPVFWFVLIPFLKGWGETGFLLIILRCLMFWVSLAVMVLTWRLAQRVTGRKETALLSLVFLVTAESFVIHSIEIRPDTFQVLFQMVSMFYFMRFVQRKQGHDLAKSALWLALAFLFLQKTVFLLAAYLINLVILRIQKKIAAGSILAFLAFFMLPVGLFWAVMVKAGMFGDYWMDAWIFNTYHLRLAPIIEHARRTHMTDLLPIELLYQMTDFSPAMKIMLKKNYLFWSLSFISCAYILTSHKTTTSLKMMAGIGFILWIPFFILRIPFGQYLMPAIPLLSIANAATFTSLFDKKNVPAAGRLLVLLVVGFMPLLIYLRCLFLYPQNDRQLEKIDFVVNHAGRNERVYDGDIQFNLFRKDLHYFWYYLDRHGQGRGLLIYNALGKNRFGDYDLCRLLEVYRPKFISNRLPAPFACDQITRYRTTPYPGLFIRWDNETFKSDKPGDVHD